MRTMKVIAAAAAVGLGLAMATATPASANLLSNAGFESPIASAAPPFLNRWEPFSLDGNQSSGGDIADTSIIFPRTGAQSLFLDISVPNSFAGVFQDQQVVAGTSVTFDGWGADILGNNGAGVEIRIEWRDSVTDTEINRTGNLVPALGTAYTFWSLTGTVPAGANVARAVIALQTFGVAPPQRVFMDDVSLVPEPASLALLGLGGLALMRRK